MEQICKNCKHFDPVTSVCDWHDLIKLETDWCYGFYPKGKENKKMTMSDFFEQLPDFTDYELEKITDAIALEIDKRAFAKRKKLKEAFFKAWKDLEDDGATIFFKESQMLEAICLEDLEIE